MEATERITAIVSVCGQIGIDEWKQFYETKIFDKTATIEDIEKWAKTIDKTFTIQNVNIAKLNQ